MEFRDELYHHGIKGQKWGVRRYQNEDGTLTDAGKRRYGTQEAADYASLTRKQKKYVKNVEKAARRTAGDKSQKEWKKAYDYADKHGLDTDDVVTKNERSKFEKLSKKAGDWEKVGKHVIEYNKMMDAAEIKEDRYYKEAKALVKKTISDLASSNRSSFVDPNPRKLPKGTKTDGPTKARDLYTTLGGRVLSDGSDDYRPKRPKNVLY